MNETSRDRIRNAIVFFMVALAIPLSAGCMSEPLQPQAAAPPTSISVNLPPKEALGRVKQVVAAPPLNLAASDEGDGVVVTDWQRHRGNFHIGRYWQERTRYRVAVIPDWNEPTARARVEVTAQTEERAAEGQTWTPAPQLNRAERAEKVASQIAAELGGTAPRAGGAR